MALIFGTSASGILRETERNFYGVDVPAVDHEGKIIDRTCLDELQETETEQYLDAGTDLDPTAAYEVVRAKVSGDYAKETVRSRNK